MGQNDNRDAISYTEQIKELCTFEWRLEDTQRSAMDD